jgi:hypothetical protein
MAVRKEFNDAVKSAKSKMAVSKELNGAVKSWKSKNDGKKGVQWCREIPQKQK